MARKRRLFSGQVSNADMHLMRVFKTVIASGGLSAAQAELGVGRSTISKQISDLETRLGIRLCNRGRAGFELTQQGEQALIYIDQFLSAADEFQTNIASVDNVLSGTVQIGMVDYSVYDQNNPLVSAIKTYRVSAPLVSINLMTGTPAEIERAVIDGRLHIGIVPDYHRYPGIHYEKLYEEIVGLFCGGDHPVAENIINNIKLYENDIYKYHLVHRGYYESDTLRNIKQRFPVGSVVNQTEAVLALVQMGVYLGFFPVHCVGHSTQQVHEIMPNVFRYSTPVCAIWRNDRRKSHIMEDFVDLLSSV